MAQELIFAQNSDMQWFYIIEQRTAPKDAWDWQEYADCFGPFETLEEAQDHEYRSDSDTSGAEIIPYGRRDVGSIAAQMMRTKQIAAQRASA